MFHRPRHESNEAVKPATPTNPVQNASTEDTGVTIRQIDPARRFQKPAEEASSAANVKTEENKMSNTEEQDRTTAQSRTSETPVQQQTAARSFPPSPASMASRMASGGYTPPAYTPAQHGPASYAMTTVQSEKSIHGQGRRLVIGEGITLSGEIEACAYLVVEGTVEAALKGASVLEIAETGTFYGTVEIDEATVAGRFEGDIMVNGRLTVTSTGSITGTISYRDLAVEAGATLDGKISPLVPKANAKKGEKPAVPHRTAKAASAARNGADDSELPFVGSGNSQTTVAG